MKVVPLTVAQADGLVGRWHRHNKGTGAAFYVFGIESNGGELVGGCVVGPLTARLLNDAPRSCELKRLVTDGTKNACSFGYGAAWRIAREMGFVRMITYTLQTESGSSLRASGWRVDDPAVPARKWKSRAPEFAHLRWSERPDACASPSFPRVRWLIGEAWPADMARFKSAETESTNAEDASPVEGRATPSAGAVRLGDSAPSQSV